MGTWKDYEAGLKATRADHGFRHDSLSRFDSEQAEQLAWGRNLVFFRAHLS